MMVRRFAKTLAPCSTSLLLVVLLATPAGAQRLPRAFRPGPASRPGADGFSATPAADPPAVNNPFTHVFSNLWTDIRHLPSKETAWILGVGTAATLAVHPADATLTFSPSRECASEETLDAGAALGGGLVQVGGATAVYVVGRMLHSPRAAGFGSDLIRAQVLNTVVTQAIKVTVDRTRPDGGSYSFPSGHASSSFATATVIARYFGWKFGVPAYAAATYVAASRLSENQHYLSDVVFGASLGVMAGRTVTVGRSRFAFALMASPHGVGLSMVRIGQ